MTWSVSIYVALQIAFVISVKDRLIHYVGRNVVVSIAYVVGVGASSVNIVLRKSY